MVLDSGCSPTRTCCLRCALDALHGLPSGRCTDSSAEREFPSDKVYRRDDRGIVGVEPFSPAQLGLLQRPHCLGREAWPDGSYR
jgi:hypothetical protein